LDQTGAGDFLLLQNAQTGPGVHPPPIQDTGDSLPEGKEAGA